MISGFIVFHKKTPSGNEGIPQGAPLWSFKTCLRHIHFSWLAEGQRVPCDHDFEIYRGQKAYEFCLEILCGLHSPVVGETEVFGQFKDFFKKAKAIHPLSKVFSDLITDVKKIRKQALIDLGSQSYGSLIRRMIPKNASLAIIGGGSLCKDILPWVYKDENDIHLYVRDKKKTDTLKTQFPKIDVNSLEVPIKESIVVVAAPVSAECLQEAIVDKKSLIIDLRGESRENPCIGFSNYISLQEFFEDIEKNKSQVLKAKNKALGLIQDIAKERFLVESFRPFGWEDICHW